MQCDASAIEVPPLPPKLRRKPQRRDIGVGKARTPMSMDEAAFATDLSAWQQ